MSSIIHIFYLYIRNTHRILKGQYSHLERFTPHPLYPIFYTKTSSSEVIWILSVISSILLKRHSTIFLACQWFYRILLRTEHPPWRYSMVYPCMAANTKILSIVTFYDIFTSALFRFIRNQYANISLIPATWEIHGFCRLVILNFIFYSVPPNSFEPLIF